MFTHEGVTFYPTLGDGATILLSFDKDPPIPIQWVVHSTPRVALLKGLVASPDAWRGLSYEQLSSIAPVPLSSHTAAGFTALDPLHPLVVFFSNKERVKRHYQLVAYMHEVITFARCAPTINRTLFNWLAYGTGKKGGMVDPDHDVVATKFYNMFVDEKSLYNQCHSTARMMFVLLARARTMCRIIYDRFKQVKDVVPLLALKKHARTAEYEYKQTLMQLYDAIVSYFDELHLNYYVNSGPAGAALHGAEFVLTPTQCYSDFLSEDKHAEFAPFFKAANRGPNLSFSHFVRAFFRVMFARTMRVDGWYGACHTPIAKLGLYPKDREDAGEEEEPEMKRARVITRTADTILE